MKQEKGKDKKQGQEQSRMEYDVNDTSRTLKPGAVPDQGPTTGLAGASDQSGNKQSKDTEGRQSHQKNPDKGK
ncbi:hypothetical protein CLV24_1015 [Pontibacter ummariensis]|uniref:Uncharacterized protein n=1 Tax=Pontibacter ummariensis TaxID=1610492 RepID=A0A239AX76_9BACT|nr:hypothetical protein [Pontibacter ummariensis]PRY16165.1 hypothetical protein CLV24_1015 [Pontibacter ummariensis]SNS00305.1 hypothetical protein SAMN06296052_1015 [Pontibacter ummariensis]